jgi:hypothetical protein
MVAFVLLLVDVSLRGRVYVYAGEYCTVAQVEAFGLDPSWYVHVDESTARAAIREAQDRRAGGS